MRARAGQRLGHGPPDAGAGSRHDRGLAGEIHGGAHGARSFPCAGGRASRHTALAPGEGRAGGGPPAGKRRMAGGVMKRHVLSCDVMVGGEAGVCGRVEGAGPLPPPVVKARRPIEPSRPCSFPAKAGTHPWLAMPPRSVESRPDRRGCRESRGWPPAQGRGDGCASESGPSLERHEMSWSVMRCHGRHASADALPFRSCIPRLPCTSFQSSPPAAVPDAAGPFFARILRGCGRVSAPARFAHLITRARRRTHFPCPFPPGFSAPAAFCRKRKRRPRKPPFLHPSYHTFPQVKPLAGRF